MTLAEHQLDHTLDHSLSGLEGKDRALEGVMKPNVKWRADALAKLKALPVGWKGTGEDIRKVVGVEPHHHNAWGSLVSAALKDELIYPNGDRVAMKAKTSHGRQTPVYERL
jgi:hypothetical protein